MMTMRPTMIFGNFVEDNNNDKNIQPMSLISSSRRTTLIGLRMQQQWSFHYQLHTESDCISYKTSFSTQSAFSSSDDELDVKYALIDTINNNNEFSSLVSPLKFG